MEYCRRCVLPTTRPGITLDPEGICSACRGHRLKESVIDWEQRRKELDRIGEEARSRSAGYDCIVPVSGGKDSWYQVIVCKELGLRVLGVTWRAPGRNELGQQNLDALVAQLAIDHVDYSINLEVERRFARVAFEQRGASGIPMHMALFHIPIRLAVQLKIPLIVWGENPQLEYGGEEEEQLTTDLDREWLAQHGCLQSTTPTDWMSDDLELRDLVAYQLPDQVDFTPRSIFLGSFLKWNPLRNMEVALAHGFKPAEEARTGSWNFADVDDDLISIHHYLKWYKFGFTRAFDNLSVQIRTNSITRDQAIATLKELGDQTPHADIQAFCRFVKRDVDWFWDVAECFRNLDIWHQEAGVWKIRNFLVPDWRW